MNKTGDTQFIKDDTQSKVVIVDHNYTVNCICSEVLKSTFG